MAEIDCIDNNECAQHRATCDKFLNERDKSYTREFRSLHELTERLFNGMTTTVKTIESKIPTHEQIVSAAHTALAGESCQRRMDEIAKRAAQEALREALDLGKGTLDIRTVAAVLLFCVGITWAGGAFYAKMEQVERDLKAHIATDKK